MLAKELEDEPALDLSEGSAVKLSFCFGQSSRFLVQSRLSDIFGVVDGPVIALQESKQRFSVRQVDGDRLAGNLLAHAAGLWTGKSLTLVVGTYLSDR